jgi:hypothetical protein
MIHVVSAMTEYQEYLNHVFSTKPIVLTTHFSQDYMAANIETSSLLRLAVTDPMIAHLFILLHHLTQLPCIARKINVFVLNALDEVNKFQEKCAMV